MQIILAGRVLRLFTSGKKSFIVSLFCSILIISNSIVASENGPFPSKGVEIKVDYFFFKAMKEIGAGDYLGGLADLEQIKKMLPNHPAGYLFTSAVLQWIIQHYRNYQYQEEFFKNIEQTLFHAENMSRLSSWRYIYLGGAYGFRGIQESEFGNFFSAFHDGLKGVNRLKKALALDPSIYDSYYGLGLYFFWKAHYTDKLFFLSGSTQDKVKGIRYINTCIVKCKYIGELAQGSLTKIYLVDNKYQKAIEVAKKTLQKSPYNIGVIRHLGHSYYRSKKYDEAIITYERVKDILSSSQLTHSNAVIEINYYLARIYHEMNRPEEVEKLYQESAKFFSSIDQKIKPIIELKYQFQKLRELSISSNDK